MNYIPEVVKMLGVEVGEEFKIESCSGKNKYSDNAIFKFDELYLKYKPHDEWILATCAQSDLLNGKLKLIKIPKSVLDEKEKEYLAYVIKPFRDRVKYIYKFTCANGDYEAIAVIMEACGGYCDYLNFPKFKKNAMYKGMELTKEYSVEDLGL